MKNTKRILAALMSAIMLGSFTALPNMTYADTDDAAQTSDVSAEKTVTVTVTVAEINGDDLIVTPVPGSWELRSSNKFRLPVRCLESGIEPAVDMMLDVEYSGQILEICPAVFNAVKKVTLHDESSSAVLQTTAQTTVQTTVQPTTTVAENRITTQNTMSVQDEADAPVSTESPAPNTSYRAMTLDEALKDMIGNYVWMNGTEPEIIPLYNVSYNGIPAVGEDSRVHNIIISKAVTVIKVKSGRELPYDDIRAAVEAEGRVMPVISKNGSDYEIISASSEDNYYYALDLIKNCHEVTAIEMQYRIYDDTANIVQFSGLHYSGELTPEELSERYPELTPAESTGNDGEDNNYTVDRTRLYDFFCRARDNGDHFDKLNCMSTCLALVNPKYYYCNKPVLIDGTDGDANIDGYVDLSDSVMIMQSLANPDKYGIKAEKGITAQGTENGDTDGNGLTNTDALEIQKSLLGIGSIPIPKDSEVDIISYDYISIMEEYDLRTVTAEGKEYLSSGVNIGIGRVGEEIGDFETVSNENGPLPAKVYRIKDITPDYAVAVKCSGSNNYCVYRYIWYRPATVGQLMDELQLEDNLSFTNVFCAEYAPEYKTVVYEPVRALIWDTLFSDRDIEISEHRSENIPNGRKAKIDIGCDLPIFGRFNFGINVYENGYVFTNLVECGAEFFISPEKAQELIEYYS